MDDDHAVYGGDIPEEYVEGESMDHDLYEEQDNDSHRHQNNAATTQIEEMKKRITELEEETNAIKELQAKVESEMGLNSSSTQNEPTREDADSRSVFVGNVDYSCTPEDLRLHFLACGTVNRITIKSDKYGHPKGFAYVEFLEPGAVLRALALNDSQLRNRKLKVTRKRTNHPGLKHFRGRVFTSAVPYPRRPFNPYISAPRYYPGYGYGKAPRIGRYSHRYNPYG